MFQSSLDHFYVPGTMWGPIVGAQDLLTVGKVGGCRLPQGAPQPLPVSALEPASRHLANTTSLCHDIVHPHPQREVLLAQLNLFLWSQMSSLMGICPMLNQTLFSPVFPSRTHGAWGGFLPLVMMLGGYLCCWEKDSLQRREDEATIQRESRKNNSLNMGPSWSKAICTLEFPGGQQIPFC